MGERERIAAGRDFAHGALTELARWVIIVMLATAVVRCADDRWTIWSRDDSDAPHARSGVKVRTDARTGCQYLESRSGDLTPRLGSGGQLLCPRTETPRYD